MKASEIGADELIREAVDLMDSGVAVGLWDTNSGPPSVGAIKDKDVIETLVQFSPDDELVIPLTSESGLVALEVTPNAGGLASIGTLLEKDLLPSRNAHCCHGRGGEIVPPFPVRRSSYKIIGAGGPRSQAHSASRLHRCTSETWFRWYGRPVEARTSSGRDADR